MKCLKLVVLATIVSFLTTHSSFAQLQPSTSCSGNYATTTSQGVDAARNRGGIVLVIKTPSMASLYLRRGDEGYNDPHPGSLAGYTAMGDVSFTKKIEGTKIQHLFSYTGALGVVDAVLTEDGTGYLVTLQPRGMAVARGKLVCGTTRP